mgnify:CR=1 FL=1
MKKNNFKFNSPIWLVSSDRSGSNLLLKILDNHSKICSPAMSHLIRFADKISTCSLTIAKKKLIIKKLFNSKLGYWKLKNLKKINFSNNVLKYIYYIFQKEMRLNNKEFLFIKEIELYKNYKIIKKLSNNPRFIFLTRDPRDMALSWKKTPNFRGGVLRATSLWINNQKGFITLKKKLNKGQFINIRYEDLIKNKKTILKKIFHFLNIDYEKNILNFYKKNETQTMSKTQWMFNNLSKPIFRNSNKFLNELTNNEIIYIEQKTSKYLKKNKYKKYKKKLSQKRFKIIEKEMIVNNDKLMNKDGYLKLSKIEKARSEKLNKVLHEIINLN